jgi:hypothetical protein
MTMNVQDTLDAKPIVYAAAPTYIRHSPSALNLFCASPAMFVLERVLGLRQPVGVPAHRGVAVEDGVTVGLKNPDASLEECCAAAYAKYDTLTAMSTDERREKFRGNIPDMVAMALEELRPYGVPSQCQGTVEWKPDGLKLPIFGYYDFHWAEHNITTDLKTTERMPGEVKVSHAKQVSFYVTSNNAAARVTYATPKKCQTYTVENIDAHRAALFQTAVHVEKFLNQSDDPQFFVDITAPDLESFYWSGPQARQMAFQHWHV